MHPATTPLPVYAAPPASLHYARTAPAPLPPAVAPVNPALASLAPPQPTTEESAIDEGIEQTEPLFQHPLSRYLGFTNELTEASYTGISSKAGQYALRSVGWAVSLLYGIGDALHNGKHAKEVALNKGENEQTATAKGQQHFAEGILFHTIASWGTPILIIHAIHKATNTLLNRAGKSSRLLPIAAGLSVIPILPKILDPVAEKIIWSLRPLTNKLFGIQSAPVQNQPEQPTPTNHNINTLV